MARIEVKSSDQIRAMRRAGLVVAEGLDRVGRAIRPGVTTADLDSLLREVLTAAGARSNFLNYGAQFGYPPFPGVACISVNETIVHGIPGDRVLQAGDIVSVDFGAILAGWHGDAARTFTVGAVGLDDLDLIETTRASMWTGIAAARVGGRVGDISAAIEAEIHARNPDYGILREYTGHGIGTAMHQAPDVPNYGRAGKGPRLTAGMCLAIEPMITISGEQAVELDDEWTVVTVNGKRAAHWENTVAILPDGVWVLTEPDGGRAELAARGVPLSSLAD